MNIVKMWKQRHRYLTWAEMPDKVLLFFFLGASGPCWFWSYVTAELAPKYLESSKVVGFSFAFVIMSIIMLMVAMQACLFGCVTKRSGELLYERWFK